jgi:hypothetical protein
MSVTNRPSRSGPTRSWLDHLDALRDALSAASPQEALPLRFEITIAENELVRRGLPLHALELPVKLPTGTAGDLFASPLGQPGSAEAVRAGAGETRTKI